MVSSFLASASDFTLNTSPQMASIGQARSARLFSEKCKRLSYWGATGVVALTMVESGFLYLRYAPAIFDKLGNLPFPGSYLALGLAELLGSAVLLGPGFPRLKLWVYGAFALIFSGDVLSALASSEKRFALASLIALLLLASSFWLRPAARRV
jgi:hypothetical protein